MRGSNDVSQIGDSGIYVKNNSREDWSVQPEE